MVCVRVYVHVHTRACMSQERMWRVAGHVGPALSTTSQETEVSLCPLTKIVLCVSVNEGSSKAWGPRPSPLLPGS